MHVNCPACSKTLSVGPEHVGKAVACPHCQRPMRIPAGPSPAAEPTKKCPYCSETILKVARRCKFCKTDIPDGYDEESAAVRLKAKENILAQQATGPDHDLPYAVRGWFRTSTIVVSALTLVGIVAAAIGLSAGERSPIFILGPLGVVLGILFGVIALILGVRDLFAVKYSGRHTPVKGAKAFWAGLCAKRYVFAYYCVLDADKDESLRLRPACPSSALPRTHSASTSSRASATTGKAFSICGARKPPFAMFNSCKPKAILRRFRPTSS